MSSDWSPTKRYDDVLAQPLGPRRQVPEVTAEPGLVVEVEDGFCGAVVAMDKAVVTLEDRSGRTRSFPWSRAGFHLDGRVVTLVRPVPRSPVASSRTASGSIAVEQRRARVAQPSRILVEGTHDSELVERIWGADLRVEGVVVERLDGADHLPDVVRELRPSRDARLGVLLDHLVDGSKETRIAASVEGPYVCVVGHPYVDVWQAVKPDRVGLSRWPDVPRGLPWKDTVAAAMGEPDAASAWRRILRSVSSWTDLEPALIGAVERLIDFVTVPPGGSA